MTRRRRERKQVVVPEPARPPSQLRLLTILTIILAAVTFLAYYPVLSCGFVYDDDLYVTRNLDVQAGLSTNGIRWALKANVAANWHPLTLLSLQLDAELFGLKPQGYHLHNLLLHVLNTILLFHLLRRMTGALWRSFIVAALFALHPLHVESVAWVSERKDVLSTLFGLLALWAYVCYTARPELWRMAAVAALLGLSLLAKPMWVTFPCLLLLLDGWPLGRWGVGPRRLIAEKWPLFLLVALSSLATVHAQQEALASNESWPLMMRVANAADSYVAYLRQTFVPDDLAVYYPHPREGARGWPAALVLIGVSAGAVWQLRRLPYLFVGWFWYLGMLVPVIGLVQVGNQARADRYTYVPLIGIFIALVWGLGDLAARGGRARFVGAAAGFVALLCGVLTWLQIGYWQNEVALWRQTLRVSPDNERGLSNLGAALLANKDPAAALVQFDRLARLQPGNVENHSSRGSALLRLYLMEQAEAVRRMQLGLEPDGTVRPELLDEAEAAFRLALTLNPTTLSAEAGLANIATVRRYVEETRKERGPPAP